MKISGSLILYTRSGCHLCEQAADLLQRAGVSWRPVDIDDDPRLAETYGLRVPVLLDPVNRQELDYPFDEARVADFIN